MVWSYETGAEVFSVSISSDGSYVAAGSYDGKVYLFSRGQPTAGGGSTPPAGTKPSPSSRIPFILLVLIVAIVGAILALRKHKSAGGGEPSGPAERHCPHCNSRLSPDANFCPECGKKVRK